MSRNLILPFFPVPPEQYDQQYMEEIVRSFSIYLRQIQNPGEGRNTQLVLTNLQTDDQGLEVGALFIDQDTNGVFNNIKIAVAEASNVRGNSVTGSIGSVTVTV
tara:strand:- start:5048 stop:5359 length:312 start_codon:yes stop_codon:yes gene_type:complete